MSPRLNRVLLATILAALWTAGSLWRAASLDLQTVFITVIVGIIAAVLMYWLLKNFSKRRMG
jgi:ABC-type Fe3+-siderophore transport system permease subunit